MAMWHAFEVPQYRAVPQHRLYSSNHSPEARERSTPSNSNKDEKQSQSEKTQASKSSPGESKTVAQTDQELAEKLESMCGGGGAAALELENGKPVTMKRGVRENMFRLI